MDSREKVLRLKSWLLAQKPEDEDTARQLQLIASLSPLLVKALPDDPAELDGYLRLIAWAIVSCRSDGAPALGLFEHEEGEWKPVDYAVGAEA